MTIPNNSHTTALQETIKFTRSHCTGRIYLTISCVLLRLAADNYCFYSSSFAKISVNVWIRATPCSALWNRRQVPVSFPRSSALWSAWLCGQVICLQLGRNDEIYPATGKWFQHTFAWIAFYWSCVFSVGNRCSKTRLSVAKFWLMYQAWCCLQIFIFMCSLPINTFVSLSIVSVTTLDVSHD